MWYNVYTKNGKVGIKMKIETFTTTKIVATQEEKQKMKNGLEVLNTLDENTNSPISCESCPLVKMCDTAPCQIGCLIHYSQKIFTKLVENT